MNWPTNAAGTKEWLRVSRDIKLSAYTPAESTVRQAYNMQPTAVRTVCEPLKPGPQSQPPSLA